MADSNVLGPSGAVYGVWSRVTHTSTNDSATHRTVGWSSEWFYRWSAGPWSNVRIIAGTTAGYKYDSGNITMPYGGSTSNKDTLWTRDNYTHAFERKETDYTVDVYTYLSTPYGTVQPNFTVTVPALPTPSAPTNCTHVRDSDNQNTISWTNNGTNPRSNNLVERSVDGGGYSQIASIAGSATSYVDSTTGADHSYSYKVRAVHAANSVSKYSGYSNVSATTYNTPSAPGTPKASRNTDNTVTVSFTNGARTETGLEYQRSNDGSTWSGAIALSGADKTALTDSPGGGTWYFRIRNTRGALASAWTAASNAVVTIIAPAAPTLKTPSSGTVVSKANATLDFSWTHNPIDSSKQTAAQLRFSTDNGSTWSASTQITGEAQTYTRNIDWAVNTQVLWQVRTKGAHADYGAWSSSFSFVVRQVPQVSITAPADDAVVVQDMPLTVTWDYSDESGTQQTATLKILDSKGSAVFTKRITGTTRSYTLEASEFLPANKSSYVITLDVQSTSTLASQTHRGFSTDYHAPATPVGYVDVDNSRGLVSLLVLAGEDAKAPSTVAMGIFRRHDDGRMVCLVDKVESGTSITDYYCPLETMVTYVFVAYTSTGVSSTLETLTTLKADTLCFINFGNEVVALTLNAKDSYQTEHDKEIFQTAGSEYPMVFYGDAKSMSGSISGTVMKDSDLPLPVDISAFERLGAYKGSVVIRKPHWDAFVADINVSHSQNNLPFQDISISWTRVRNHGLAI